MQSRACIKLPDLRIAYLPIPKVASMSIKQCLGEHLKASRETIKAWQRGHVPTALIKDIQGEQYEVFGVVRNPYSRLVSAYCSKFLSDSDDTRGKYQKMLIERKYGPPMEFSRFIRMVCDEEDSKANVHWRSQVSFIRTSSNLNEDGDWLIDRLFSYEKLGELQDYLKSKGVKAELSHINPSKHENYRYYYNQECIELVRKRYEADLHMFDYDY